MAKVVTALPMARWRKLAEVAGGDPMEIIWHEATGEVEVPDVDQAALDAAEASMASGATPATQADVTAKIEALSASASALIEAGFQSTAAGLHAAPKWYDSKVEDQLNLVGNAAAGDDTIHPYREIQAGPKTYANHTNAQLQAVLRDGRNRKLEILQEFTAKKYACLAATTLGELDAVTWTMT